MKYGALWPGQARPQAANSARQASVATFARQVDFGRALPAGPIKRAARAHGPDRGGDLCKLFISTYQQQQQLICVDLYSAEPDVEWRARARQIRPK